MNKVTVVGSINLDHMVRTPRMPQGGETIHVHEVFSAGGGKGANQAVAIQRLGSETHFIGAVGNDDEGKMMLELLGEEGMDLSTIRILEDTVTGQAFVIVDDASENRILVYGGANMALTPEHIEESASLIESSQFVVSQFEVDLACIEKAFRIARNAGVKTVLNPAPAKKEVPSQLLDLTDIVIPNETEAELLTGIKVETEADMRACAEAFHNHGVETVIITLGSRGAYFHTKEKEGIVPAFKVDAKDTTAAGDTFIGAFMSCLQPDASNLEEAIQFGNRASSIAVQRYGAQPSIPFKEELEA